MAQVALLAEQDSETAAGGVARDASTVDSAADDQKVEGLVARQAMLPVGRASCCAPASLVKVLRPGVDFATENSAAPRCWKAKIKEIAVVTLSVVPFLSSGRITIADLRPQADVQDKIEEGRRTTQLVRARFDGK